MVPSGLGTGLKPSYEPIVVARKPFAGTVAGNVAQWGTGALNIDACRISTADDLNGGTYRGQGTERDDGWGMQRTGGAGAYVQPLGRWPANVLLDEHSAAQLDQMTGDCGANGGGENVESRARQSGFGMTAGARVDTDNIGGASRFYYVAKPSREERDYGCESLPQKTAAELTNRKPGSAGLQNPRAGIRAGSMDRDINARVARNSHPTVKPVELMRWLVKLVTPPGGTCLDPFMGSGSTGMACRYELREFIGIEKEAEYVQIAERRIAAVAPLFHAVNE